MYCTRCGVQLRDHANYCSHCGSPTGSVAESNAAVSPRCDRVLSRPYFERRIAGVCAGFARYFGLDVTLVRIIWLVMIFWPVPIGLVAYIVAWIVMPRDHVPMYQPLNSNA